MYRSLGEPYVATVYDFVVAFNNRSSLEVIFFSSLCFWRVFARNMETNQFHFGGKQFLVFGGNEKKIPFYG